MADPGRTVDVVVVGAGAAGLAAAWQLRDRELLVLEAEPRVGGRLCSQRRDGYWLNFGGHVLAGAGSQTARLLDQTGVAAAEVPGVLSALALNGRVLAGGRVESYPLRMRLRGRDRLAMARAGARLRLAVRRYGQIARLRPGETSGDRQARVLAFDDGRSFADFLGPVPADVDAVFRATIRRSSGEPEQVSAGYGIGYFQLVWDRDAGLTRNVLGGSATLPEAIAAALGERVITGARAERVTQRADGVEVRYLRDGARAGVRARAVVVAVPAPAARALVAELPADTAAALEQIAYGPYVVGAFLTDEAGPDALRPCVCDGDPQALVQHAVQHGQRAPRRRSPRAGRQPDGVLGRSAGGRLRGGRRRPGGAAVRDRAEWSCSRQLRGRLAEAVISALAAAGCHIRGRAAARCRRR